METINIKNKKWTDDEFYKMRKEVLATWPTGKEVDLDEAIAYHKALPEHKVFSNKLNKAKQEGRRIIAVGTTSVRVLESCVDEQGKITAAKKETKIFIYPSYKFKVVDGLITNFHLPESTLIMLVSAFAGYDQTMNIYAHAVKDHYRFFSFGDAMFIY